MITSRYYLSSTVLVVAASVLAMATLTCGCPQATGWYYSRLTNKCYRGLFPARLNFADAQKRCNELRSNLFQFNIGDSKEIFDNLQDELYSYRNTTEFRELNWIGLTDRGKVEQYVYLNKFPLASIAPDTYIVCPDSQPASCKPANRCVYLNLDNRGTPKRQIYSGNCDTTLMAAICYAPVGGTDQFDQVPALGAGATAASLAALALSGFLSVAVKSLI